MSGSKAGEVEGKVKVHSQGFRNAAAPTASLPVKRLPFSNQEEPPLNERQQPCRQERNMQKLFNNTYLFVNSASRIAMSTAALLCKTGARVWAGSSGIIHGGKH